MKMARNLHLDEFNDDDENDATKILIDPQDDEVSCLKEATDNTRYLP